MKRTVQRTLSTLTWICIVACCLIEVGASASTAVEAVRLSKHIKPRNYKLKLEPNIHTKSFKGSVVITIDVEQSSDRITLHASDHLNVTKVVLYDSLHNQSFPGIQPTAKELLKLSLAKPIAKGTYKIFLEYSGRLDKVKGIGFYASSLKNGGVMVASKFQPTYARQAFPCFDEPEFKATFDTTLVKPVDYIALSNMNEISSSHDNKTNKDTVKFATSVPMSSYLACFVVCDFENKQTEIDSHGIGDNFTLRAFAQKGETYKIDFSMDIAKRATEFYIKYYEVPFPLPKLDMIAIPDYVSGATEHWGLVTFRETALLVDPAAASARNRLGVANTVAHELAHMWFGNLVTNKWWNDLWLNEGFATYMQVKCLDAIEPSWSMLDQFLIRSLHPVLHFDARVSSHPIVQTVATPDQITAIFDTISYNKGASVLRMLEGFTGAERYRRGVSGYLHKYKFSSAVTQDLLDCLRPGFEEQHPGLDLTHIMDTWTRQTGYPVVTVAPGPEPGAYELRQQRFLLDPAAKYDENESQFKYRWFVPITYKTARGVADELIWFPDSAESVTIRLSPDDAWLKVNNDHVGYYRVNYPPDTWRQLAELLKAGSDQLSAADRAQLLDDSFALADAGLQPHGAALALAGYLRRERALVPWSAAQAQLVRLAERLRGDDRARLDKYVRHLVKPLYEKLSEETNDTLIHRLQKTQTLGLAAYFGLPEAITYIRTLFVAWLDEGKAVEPELRDNVYYYGMQQATPAQWQRAWRLYLGETDAHEAVKLRRALAAVRDRAVLDELLTLAWDESNVRSQDYLTLLGSVAANPEGEAMVWERVRAAWPALVQRFSLNSRYLGALVPDVTAGFKTEERLKEMQDFFSMYPAAGAGAAARRRALEAVRTNIAWAATHAADVASWLAEHEDRMQD